MKRYNVSKRHPLFKDFMGEISKAMFLNSQADWDAMIARMRERGVSEDEIKKITTRYAVSNGRITRLLLPVTYSLLLNPNNN